jgi:drug/metabolite transporter (DMT)-like permease
MGMNSIRTHRRGFSVSNLLIALMILIYTFQAAFANLYAKHYTGKKTYSSPVYSVIYGLLVALVTFAFSGFSFHPSRATLIFGIVNGAALVLYNTLIIKAAGLGPFSVTMMFNLSGGILIPTLWSVLHDGERLAWHQIAAICLMLIAFFFLNPEDKKEAESGKLSAKFIFTVALLGCTNGLYGILMNAAEKNAKGSENTEMIVTTFFVSALFALIVLILRAKKEAFPAFRMNVKAAASALAASVCACAAVNLLMFVLSLVSPAVLYTMDNGGVLIVSVLWSALVLREKLGKKKLIGLILAIIAIFALSFKAPEAKSDTAPSSEPAAVSAEPADNP